MNYKTMKEIKEKENHYLKNKGILLKDNKVLDFFNKAFRSNSNCLLFNHLHCQSKIS